MAGLRELEIEIDRSACHGVGECVLRAGRSFALDDDDRAKLILPAAGSDSIPRSAANRDDDLVVLTAARACPNFAISVSRGGVRLV